ncbi:MAG TPA: sulfurtransferase complex subunit TusB [Hyphomicrobiales bacterium]|nr:sulfurtransferase complex subunit TusB [Hyphomicrobiales bacterium]
MNTLFVLNRHDTDTLAACQACLHAGDALLLMEEAVYLLLDKRDVVQSIDNFPAFALSGDLVARGISAKIPPRVECVDYAGFVALTLRFDRIITW